MADQKDMITTFTEIEQFLENRAAYRHAMQHEPELPEFDVFAKVNEMFMSCTALKEYYESYLEERNSGSTGLEY